MNIPNSLSKSEVCKRFNQLRWHDSKLIAMRVCPTEDRMSHDIELDVELLIDERPGNYKWKASVIRLVKCAILKIDFDLDGKRVCSHDIASASCATDIDFGERFSRKDEGEFKNLLHFRFVLIPPGGEMNVLGEGFTIP